MSLSLALQAALGVGCAEFVDAGATEATGEVRGASSSTAAADGGLPTTTAGPTSLGTTGGPDAKPDPEDDGDSRDAGSDSETSGGGNPPECGNGRVEDGEACDDANRDDADGCTVNCELSSCRDGRQNGTETAVDCGGACAATCAPGEGCEEGTDCTDGVCSRAGVCAVASCDDGVLNNGEITADCGPVCGTAPANVLLNGDFESSTEEWVVENPEINPQSAYFGGGSTNAVVEMDRDGNTTSRWQQGFQVPEYQVGLTLALRLRVGDRSGQGDDVGGLLIRITGPDTAPLVLTGMAGPDFNNNGSAQLGVDATSVSSFQTAVVHFDAVAAGGHVLELLEQTSGGAGLNDGGGIIIDDVEVLLVNCEAG